MARGGRCVAGPSPTADIEALFWYGGRPGAHKGPASDPTQPLSVRLGGRRAQIHPPATVDRRRAGTAGQRRRTPGTSDSPPRPNHPSLTPVPAPPPPRRRPAPRPRSRLPRPRSRPGASSSRRSHDTGSSTRKHTLILRHTRSRTHDHTLITHRHTITQVHARITPDAHTSTTLPLCIVSVWSVSEEQQKGSGQSAAGDHPLLVRCCLPRLTDGYAGRATGRRSADQAGAGGGV